MELAFLVYGISVISSMYWMAKLGAVVFAVVLLICLAWWSDAYGTRSVTTTLAVYWCKRFAVSLSVCIALIVVLPSEKVAYTMVGAYAAQQIAQDPKVQQLGGKVLAILEQKLDTYIAEGAAAAKK